MAMSVRVPGIPWRVLGSFRLLVFRGSLVKTVLFDWSWQLLVEGAVGGDRAKRSESCEAFSVGAPVFWLPSFLSRLGFSSPAGSVPPGFSNVYVV